MPNPPAGSIPDRSPVTLTTSYGRQRWNFSACSKVLHCFLFPPRGRDRKLLGWGHSKSVTFRIGTCCLDHHFLLQQHSSQLKKAAQTRDFYLGRGRRGHGEWHMTHKNNNGNNLILSDSDSLSAPQKRTACSKKLEKYCVMQS